MVGEIHQNDVGTRFIITMRDENNAIINVGPASFRRFYFRPPGTNPVMEKTPSLYSDGADGKLVYTTITNDLSVAGRWKVQAKIVLPNGEWWSDILEFEVYKNLT